jgi:hypothetical protein
MRIYEYENVLTKKQCDAIIKASKFSKETNIPDNQVYNVDFYDINGPQEDFLAPLVQAYDKYHQEYNPELKRTIFAVMEYIDGQGKIVRHQDSNDPNPEVPKTNYTLMVYLNDGFEEGETVFFDGDEELTIVPKTGKLLIIPGDIPHEARMPKGKNKYISIARYVVI